MSHFILLSLAILAFVGMASSQIPMGAASFGWPPPRIWDKAAENNSPCGSSEDPGERTNFTYYRGYVLLFTQAKAWNLQLGVSLYSIPQSAADFKPLLRYVSIAELDAGITCINVPNAPGDVQDGHEATLQLKYNSQYGSSSGRNMTFFVCADITYVAPENIPYRVPCFNTTEPKDVYTGPTVIPKPTPKPMLDPPKQIQKFTPGQKKHKFPKWAFSLVAFGGAFLGAFFVYLLFKYVIIPRRERRNREAIKQEAS